MRSATACCAAPDRSFGRLALKEFGPATGILDIYPLEVVEHILARYPAFLPKVGFGRLFADVPRDASRPLLLMELQLVPLALELRLLSWRLQSYFLMLVKSLLILLLAER